MASAWRWRNLPLPEPHVAGLAIGLVLQFLHPFKSPSEWLSRGFGLVFVMGGLSLAGWAVKTAAETDLDNPERLIIRGPYAFSRNPMYVAWDAIYIGVSLLANSIWPLVFFPGVVIWNHLQILKEEGNLSRRFATAYPDYASHTRRYL